MKIGKLIGIVFLIFSFGCDKSAEVEIKDVCRQSAGTKVTIQSVIFVKNFRQIYPANLMEKIIIPETSNSVSIIPDREMSEFLKTLPQR